MLLFLTSCIIVSQSLTKPIDYTTRAKPISQVLAELSKQTGVQVFCTSDLDNEPVILKFNHVPLKDAMDKIAYVFAGEWKQHQNGMQLQRSDEAEKLHQEMIKADAEDYVAGVKQAMKRVGMDTAYSTENAKGEIADFLHASAQQEFNPQLYIGLHDHDPVVRLLLRILAKVDPKQVVDLPRMPRVFSNKPTKLERQLPDNIQDDIQEFETAEQVLEDAIEATPNQSQQTMNNLRLVLASQSKKPVDRILISVAGASGRFNVGIWLADDAGVLIAHGGVDINGRADEAANIKKQQDLARTNQITATLGPIALDILPNINNAENFRRVKPDTKAILLSPTKNEPLAIAASDVVLGLADATKDNVAFLPPDSMDAWCYQIGRTGKVSLAALEQQADFSKELDVSEDNGWLIGAPLDPLETARERLSRPAMEAFLTANEKSHRTNIDDLAIFEADARPDSNKTILSDALMAMYNANFYECLPTVATNTEPCLALLGTLDDQQREKARSGGIRIAPDALTDQQVEYLHEWLLGYGAQFTPGSPDEDTSAPWKSFDIDLTDAMKTLDGQGFPTEVMGDDRPATSYLQVVEKQGPFYDIRPSANAKKHRYGTDLEGLAWNVAKTERPDIFPQEERRKLDFIGIGTNRTLTMRYMVGTVSQLCTFNEDHDPPLSAPTVSLDEALRQLTPEQRLDYTQMLQRWRARFAKQKPLPANGVTPPNH